MPSTTPEDKCSVAKQRPEKKRKRISLACTNCKARKIKCNRGKPCNSCKRNQVPEHLCIYKESPFIPTVENALDPQEALLLVQRECAKLKEELNLLKIRGTAPYAPIDSLSDIGHTASSKVIKRYETIFTQSDRAIYYGSSCWITISEKHAESQDLLHKIMSHFSNTRRDWQISNGFKFIPPQEYAESDTSDPEVLLRNLSEYLPEHSRVREYIEIFCISYWAYATPVFDPTTLLNDFQTFFVKDESSGKCRLIANKSVDYAKISLIVCVFKIVLLVMNSSIKYGTYDEKGCCSRYVQKLLELSKSEQKATIPALQTLIFLDQLKKIDPKDGDDGAATDGAMLFKSAVNMAITMGLHSDIDHIYRKESSTFRSLLKSIWKFLYTEDAYVSFSVGLPLTIDDNYVNMDFLDQDSSFKMKLAKYVRASCYLLLGQRPVTVGQLDTLIRQLEGLGEGEMVRLSSDIKTLSNVDEVVGNFDLIASINDKMRGLFVLHVLWETLGDGLDPDDPWRVVCGTAAMKYSVLCVIHFIELLHRFNRLCFKASMSEDTVKLYKMVDIVSSIIGIFKLVLIRAYVTLFSNEMRFYKAPSSLPSGIDKTFQVHIAAVEKLEPTDESSKLGKLLRSPAFAQGLMALACKHLLQLQNQSFATVFNFNLCLYSVVACYKSFDDFVEKHTPQDKFAMRKQIKPSVRYEDSKGNKDNHEKLPPLLSLQPTWSSFREKYNNTEMAEPSGSMSSLSSGTPTSIDSILTDTTGLSLSLSETSTEFYNSSESLSFDFFDFKDDAVDRLFSSILTNDQLFLNFDEQQPASGFSPPGLKTQQ